LRTSQRTDALQNLDSQPPPRRGLSFAPMPIRPPNRQKRRHTNALGRVGSEAVRLPYGGFEEGKAAHSRSRQAPQGRIGNVDIEARAHIEESSQETAPGKLDPIHNQGATIHPAPRHASTIRPRPCPSPTFDRHPGPAPLWPPAHRAPLCRRSPPALHHFRGGGGEGVAPHVACGDYLHQHKSF